MAGLNEGMISSSYFVSVVSGGSRVGGLVGSNGGVIRIGYWNVDTSSQSAGIGHSKDSNAQSKTTAELQSPIDYSSIYEQWYLDLDNTDGDDDEGTGKDIVCRLEQLPKKQE